MRVLLEMRPTYQRLLAVATAFFLVTGCGDKGLDKPLPKPKATMVVHAPWRAGARIPKRYTCDGGDVKPDLSWSGAGSHDFAFVMVDPDAPGGTFVHWIQWGKTEGKNSFGKVGYNGPCPPKGDKPHRYVVTVYALRKPLGLPAGSDPGKAVEAIRANAFASGSTTGLYGR